MRLTACVHLNYFSLDDARIVHESSLSLLSVRELIENPDDVELLRGEFLREQAYALEGAEAVAIFSENAFYRIDADGGITAGKEFAFNEFEIPEGVKIIRKNAFRGIGSLTSVTFPGSVEIIEEDAFNCCQNLAKIKFNYGVKSIKEGAFANTRIRSDIYLPASITFISPRNAFTGAFTWVYVDRSMPSECIAALRRCNLRVKYI